MKIRLKAPEGLTSTGIYGKDGKEMPVGYEMDVKEEPKGWKGRYDIISGGPSEGKTAVVNPADSDSPRTALEVLEMAKDPNVQFMAFKSAASKLLGDKTPSKKDEIIAALEELATQP